MLTELEIRNFKALEQVKIDLGDRVVFIGPNNSGKTTALQALALWDIGVKRWIEKRGAGAVPPKRPGVTVNRRDLVAAPVPEANLLWRNLRVRGSSDKGTKNIRIDIIVRGITDGEEWECGVEFDYANEEAFYCRPLRLSEDDSPQRMIIPPQAEAVHVAFLPPMSGLAAKELRIDSGAINVLVGEGRTAEVVRNLCLQVLSGEHGEDRWRSLVERIKRQFGVELERPRYIGDRGEITLAYRDAHDVRLDISSSGRGLQQTLLLLAHMMVNPGSVLLLDEPDAHLEILRQRQIYQVLTDAAREFGSQLIAASHSEIILNEAAGRDIVVAFVGRPHRIDDRGTQVLKSLRSIGFDQYYQAEDAGWVLFLEGSTDLSILQVFAETLEHPTFSYLDRPFVCYVENQPKKAQEHFHGLVEAKPDLVGFALYDRLDRSLPSDPRLQQRMWSRREIENYLVDRDVLQRWAIKAGGDHSAGPLFSRNWGVIMEETIATIEGALAALGRPSPWGPDIKITDDFLDPLFNSFFERLKLPNLMRKTDYHVLARFVPRERIDHEVVEVLDAILEVATQATPGRDAE